MDIKVKQLMPSASLPQYKTQGAACFDFEAQETKRVFPGDSALFGTGLAFEIPETHAMLIFSRSGHGFNSSVRLANCVGVIDSDYRGEVMIKLTHDDESGEELNVYRYDRIAQGLVLPVEQVRFIPSENLSETARGANGFGSTSQKRGKWKSIPPTESEGGHHD